MTNISALILAGGQSKRMGQDKALLSLHGRPLLHHICEVALACTSDVSIMTPWPERYQSFLSSSVRFLEEPRFNEQSQGPLFALYQGFNQVEHEWLLLLACDMPGLTAPMLNEWKLQLPPVTDSAVSVAASPVAMLPRSTYGWEPLCGFYHRQCLISLDRAIKEGIRGFQPWLAAQNIATLSAPDSFLQNCNTPAQWAKFMASQS